MEVPAVPYEELTNKADGEKSESIHPRIQKARTIQTNRFKGKQIHSNASMEKTDIRKYCKIDKEGESLLKTAMDKLELSARAYDRILKVSRTIADMEN